MSRGVAAEREQPRAVAKIVNYGPVDNKDTHPTVVADMSSIFPEATGIFLFTVDRKRNGDRRLIAINYDPKIDLASIAQSRDLPSEEEAIACMARGINQIWNGLLIEVREAYLGRADFGSLVNDPLHLVDLGRRGMKTRSRTEVFTTFQESISFKP